MVGRPPNAFEFLDHDRCEALDEVRDIVVGWKNIAIVQETFPLIADMWSGNAKSPVLDFMERSRAGVLVVLDSQSPRSEHGLFIVYSTTELINPRDEEDQPFLYNPKWGFSCERLVPNL